MKTTVTFSDFTDNFRKIRPDSFSYEGLRALFNHLEIYERDCDTELELDVIALCCDYTEYADIAEFQEAVSKNYETIADIETETTVIKIDNRGDDTGFIIQNF